MRTALCLSGTLQIHPWEHGKSFVASYYSLFLLCFCIDKKRDTFHTMLNYYHHFNYYRVNTQRRHYKLMKDGKHSSMTEERVAALESIGFVWVTSRGAPAMKSKGGQKPILETTKSQPKLDAHEIAARRFPNRAANDTNILPHFPGMYGVNNYAPTTHNLAPGFPSAFPPHHSTETNQVKVSPKSSLEGNHVSSNRVGSEKKRRWICDVCNVAAFNSFEEACAHESQCSGGLKAKH